MEPSTFGTQKQKRKVLTFKKILEIIGKLKKGASAVVLQNMPVKLNAMHYK